MMKMSAAVALLVLQLVACSGDAFEATAPLEAADSGPNAEGAALDGPQKPEAPAGDVALLEASSEAPAQDAAPEAVDRDALADTSIAEIAAEASPAESGADMSEAAPADVSVGDASADTVADVTPADVVVERNDWCCAPHYCDVGTGAVVTISEGYTYQIFGYGWVPSCGTPDVAPGTCVCKCSLTGSNCGGGPKYSCGAPPPCP